MRAGFGDRRRTQAVRRRETRPARARPARCIAAPADFSGGCRRARSPSSPRRPRPDGGLPPARRAGLRGADRRPIPPRARSGTCPRRRRRISPRHGSASRRPYRDGTHRRPLRSPRAPSRGGGGARSSLRRAGPMPRGGPSPWRHYPAGSHTIAAMKRLDPALLWLGLVVLLFADLLFLPVMIFGRDVNSYFLPLESAVHRAWASGRLPLWFAEVSGGKPLLPNPNAGVFYPLRLLAAALPFAAGFKLYLVAHVFLAGWGAMRLARALGVSRGGELVAAATYALSGPFLSTVLFSNMLPGAALMPWAAFAGLRLADRPGARRAAAAAALLALAILAGEPFTLLLCAAFFFAFAASAEPDRRLRATALSAGACAAAVAAAAIQLVPMFLYLPETFRAQ